MGKRSGSKNAEKVALFWASFIPPLGTIPYAAQPRQRV